jgi:hypothetical protein
MSPVANLTLRTANEADGKAIRGLLEHSGLPASDLSTARPECTGRPGTRSMRPIPITPETAEAARRIIWFEEPEKALADPIRFMAYAMTYAHHSDMRVIRQFVSDDEIRQALDNAPPGTIDAR